MRIAIIMTVGAPWSRETALGLARRGHDVHVVDFATTKSERLHLQHDDPFQRDDIARFGREVAGMHWLRSRFSSDLRYVTAAPACRRAMHRIAPDAVVALYGGGNAGLALLTGRRPVAVWVVGSDVLLARGFKARLASVVLKHADIVMANGDYLARRTRELAPGARVHPLLLGVAPGDFSLDGKPDGPIRILSNRGFAPVYQNDVIVRALQGLDPAIAGEYELSFASSGPELERVRALADAILPEAVRRRVHFLGGVSRERMHELLRESHVFVSMARSDGTATSLLEAMASGLYPVTTDIPQNRDWVEPPRGELVGIGDATGLADALARAIATVRTRREVLEANRRLIEERADSARSIDQLVAYLEALRSSHGPRRAAPWRRER